MRIGLGDRPDAELVRAAGIGVGETGGIGVDDHRRSDTPHVWVAADCVGSRHRITRRSVVVALGTHANKQGRLAGTHVVGGEGAGKRIDVLAAALWNAMTVAEVSGMDLSHAPPFSPLWNPVRLAAGKAASRL